MTAIDEFMFMLGRCDEEGCPRPDMVLLPYDFAQRVKKDSYGAMPCLLGITEGRLSHIDGVRVAVTPDVDAPVPLYKAPCNFVKSWVPGRRFAYCRSFGEI